MSDSEAGYLPMGMKYSFEAKKKAKYCPISQTKKNSKLPANIQNLLQEVVSSYNLLFNVK